MDKLTIRGKVFSGKGEGEKFLKLPWVKKQIVDKMGFEPFRGTLNIRLSKDDLKLKKRLQRAPSINIVPVAGFYPGKCLKARFMDSVECAIVVPQIPRYPHDVIEIVAEANLRGTFQLKDGDIVEVSIPIDFTVSACL